MRIELDLGPQVLSVSLPEETAWSEEQLESELSATPPRDACRTFLPAAVLAAKAKAFDDGLMAAVERAARDGAGCLPSKSRFVAELAAAMATDGRAAEDGAFLRLALAMGVAGADPPVVRRLAPAVAEARAAFLADALRSKPLGIYTWSADLAAVFRGDRALQAPFDVAGDALALALRIAMRPDWSDAYRRHLELAERLTNPLAKPDLRPLVAAVARGDDPARLATRGMCPFPPSASHETDLVKQLYGDQPIPEGFDLIAELAARVRDGRIDLTPGPEAGWYGHQTFAFEPLVAPERAPEAARLRLDDAYRAHLGGLFRSLLAMTRETHVKQLEIPAAGCAMAGEPPVVVKPDLALEPLAEHYERRAVGYGFVAELLRAALGEGALAALRRLTPEGEGAIPLDRELADMEALHLAACAVVRRQLGMDPPGAAQDEAPFTEWLAGLERDADVARDTRLMVPLYHDVGRDKTKVLVVLGWATRSVEVGFARPPVVRMASAGIMGRLRRQPEVELRSVRHALSYPVSAEILVKRLRDRDELRALCDRHRTASAIVRELERG